MTVPPVRSVERAVVEVCDADSVGVGGGEVVELGSVGGSVGGESEGEVVVVRREPVAACAGERGRGDGWRAGVGTVRVAARWEAVQLKGSLRTLGYVDGKVVAMMRRLLRGGAMCSKGPMFASVAIALACTHGAAGEAVLGKLLGGQVGWVQAEAARKATSQAGAVVAEADRGGGAAARKDVGKVVRRLLEAGKVGAAVDALGDDGGGGGMAAAEVASAVAKLFPQHVEGFEAPVVVAANLVVAAGGRSRVREAIAGSGWEEWEKVVTTAIWEMNPQAQPGPSGFRAAWLKGAVVADGGQDGGEGGGRRGEVPVKRMVAQWVDGILGGGARELLGLVRLRLLPKPNGGARPIGVGEAVGQLAKKVVATWLLTQVQARLEEQGQWGVGAADGCRRLAAVASAACAEGWCVTGLDVSNAFNSVHRRSVWEVVNGVTPEVAPFVAHALSATTMVGEGVSVEVRRGVVQGCPMSPLLFAMVMGGVAVKVVEKCKARGVKVWLVGPVGVAGSLAQMRGGDVDVAMGWYADDGTLLWKDAEKLKVAMEVVKEELAAVGLQLSVAKCKVVAGMGVDGDVVKRVAEGLGMAKVDAMEVLGVPVGDVVESRRMVMEAIEARAKKLEEAWEVGSPFAEVAVLRGAGLAVSVRWVLEAVAAGVVDEGVVEAVAAAEDRLHRHIFGPFAGDVTDAALRQVRTPLTAGGLGLLTLDRAGHLVGGKWVARSEAEREAWDTANREAVGTALIGEALSVQRRRWMELGAGRAMKGSPKPLAWLGCAQGLKVAREAVGKVARETDWRAGEDGAVVVESMVVAMVMGVRVWPQALDGEECRSGHGSSKRGEHRVAEGRGAHWEQCAVATTHARHQAVVAQLGRELRAVGCGVEFEMTQGEGGKAVKGRREKGKFVQGDVVATLPGGRGTVWMDTTISSVAGMVAGSQAGSAARWAYDEKVKKLREAHPTVHPIAWSTSSLMDGRSRRTLVESLRLSAAAVDRVTAAMMIAQAQSLLRIRGGIERHRAARV